LREKKLLIDEKKKILIYKLNKVIKF
jgi:hypothetical protein